MFRCTLNTHEWLINNGTNEPMCALVFTLHSVSSVLQIQAVFLAVYVHFGVCLISRQYIVDDSNGSNKVNASITSEVSMHDFSRIRSLNPIVVVKFSFPFHLNK